MKLNTHLEEVLL